MFEIRSEAKQIERKQHVHYISTDPITSKGVGETTIHLPISALALWLTSFWLLLRPPFLTTLFTMIQLIFSPATQVALPYSVLNISNKPNTLPTSTHTPTTQHASTKTNHSPHPPTRALRLHLRPSYTRDPPASN
jgi:hypothetical protein